MNCNEISWPIFIIYAATILLVGLGLWVVLIFLGALVVRFVVAF